LLRSKYKKQLVSGSCSKFIAYCYSWKCYSTVFQARATRPAGWEVLQSFTRHFVWRRR